MTNPCPAASLAGAGTRSPGHGPLIRRWGGAWLALGAVVVALGCDPIMTVRGVVKSAPAGCPQPSGEPVRGLGQPIGGAQVHLHCPHADEPQLLSTTDAQGRFTFGSVGFLDESCEVRVTKDGYHAQSFAVAELCAAMSTFVDSAHCHSMSVYAELIPHEVAAAPAKAAP